MKGRTGIFLLLLPFVLFSCSCKKTSSLGASPVLYKSVDTYVDYSGPTYAALANPGGYVYYNNAGNKGLIILQDFSGSFWAFDRTCPYHVTSPCATIYMANSGLNMVCGSPDRCCASTYGFDGTVTHGPSTYPLKAYQVTQSGTILHITN